MNKSTVPHYRVDFGKGFTLAWDVMLYGIPNEENVRRFIDRFRDKMDEKRLPMDSDSAKLVDQNTGQVLVEIKGKGGD